MAAFHSNVERLQTSIKQLQRQCEQIYPRWNDKVRQHFEKTYWAPLLRQTQATLKEMHNLAETIAQAEKRVK